MAKRNISKIKTSKGNVQGRRSDGTFGKKLSTKQAQKLPCEKTVNDGK